MCRKLYETLDCAMSKKCHPKIIYKVSIVTIWTIYGHFDKQYIPFIIFIYVYLKQ